MQWKRQVPLLNPVHVQTLYRFLHLYVQGLGFYLESGIFCRFLDLLYSVPHYMTHVTGVVMCCFLPSGPNSRRSFRAQVLRQDHGLAPPPRSSGSGGTPFHVHWWFWTATIHYEQGASKGQFWKWWLMICPGGGEVGRPNLEGHAAAPQGGRQHVRVAPVPGSWLIPSSSGVPGARVASSQPEHTSEPALTGAPWYSA